MSDFPRGGVRGLRAPLLTAPAACGGHGRRGRRADGERPGVRARYHFGLVAFLTAYRKATAADRAAAFEPPDNRARFRRRRRGRWNRRQPSKKARRMMTSLGVRNTNRY